MKNELWNWRPIGELFEIGAGKTMSSSARSGTSQKPFLRTSNVLWDEIDLSSVDTMSMSEDELKDKSLLLGDLLVCEGGDIGRAAVWTAATIPMSFQNHLHRLRSVKADVEPRFYVFFLQSAFTQLGIFEGAGNKTTIPNLSRNRLAALEVPHPPLAEQQAITQILGQVRSALGIESAIAEAASELKRATMRELFTRGLRGEVQKHSDIGFIPQSWGIVALCDVCTTLSGGTPPKSELSLWTGAFPWVSGKDLKTNRLLDSTDHITAEAAQVYSKVAPAGAVLVLIRGMGLANGLALSLIDRPMAFNQDLKALIPSSTLKSPYLMHALSYAGMRMLENVATAAHGTLKLSQDDLCRFQIGLPSDEEQHQIAEVLDTIDKKIEIHKKKRAVLNDLFKALLHKLMTGKIRVADLDLSALTPLTGAVKNGVESLQNEDLR